MSIYTIWDKIRSTYLRNKFWRADRKKGSPIESQYNEIEFILEHSIEQGRSIRENALHKLLVYYQNNSKYYSSFLSLNLTDYPVQDKISLIHNHDYMVVNEAAIPGQEGPVFVQKTSGSTGTPLSMPQNTLKRQRRIAEIKYFGEISGFRSHEKLIHLRTWNQWQAKTSNQINKENIIPFDVKRIGENDMRELCELINTERAVSLRGYASCFDRLSRCVEKYGYSFPSLNVIISTSESLEDDVRARVKESMGCEITSQYANEECGILAYEHVPTKEKDNPMYFNWASYYVEILKLDSDDPAEYGEIGRIVLTDLYNYAFPVIRYDTGDTCLLLPPDEFSHGYPVMGKLYGRRFDLTYSTDGTPIYPLAYGRIIKNYDFVSLWQFVQNSERDYELRLVLNHKNESLLEEIKNNIMNILGEDSHLVLKITDDIPVLTSGKRKPVINNWKR